MVVGNQRLNRNICHSSVTVAYRHVGIQAAVLFFFFFLIFPWDFQFSPMSNDSQASGAQTKASVSPHCVLWRIISHLTVSVMSQRQQQRVMVHFCVKTVISAGGWGSK